MIASYWDTCYNIERTIKYWKPAFYGAIAAQSDMRRNPIMTIDKLMNGTNLTITLTGRLDTNTAPKLESELRQSLNGITELILDLANLEYLSSAGLRVLLAAQKVMNKQGQMIVRHVNETIMEVFEITGFVDILTIE